MSGWKDHNRIIPDTDADTDADADVDVVRMWMRWGSLVGGGGGGRGVNDFRGGVKKTMTDGERQLT